MLDFTRFEILTFDCYGTLINWEAGILWRFIAFSPPMEKDRRRHDPQTLRRILSSVPNTAHFGPYREVLESVVRQFCRGISFRSQP